MLIWIFFLFDLQNNHRARDDLDMEVVLRSNPSENTISAPPDVIRCHRQNNEYLFDKMN